MAKNPKWSSLGGDGRPAGCLLCRCLHWVYTCCVFNTRSECKVGCVRACVYVSVCVCPSTSVRLDGCCGSGLGDPGGEQAFSG